MLKRIKEIILGKPLATKAISYERLSNAQGLAIFSSDALSSTAYATEEILLALTIGGSAAFTFYSLPIAAAIAVLIVLVSISYQQVIHTYPQGGGVYHVARQNLGETPALIGAASLLIDYILTTAVSTAAGVAAITSAFPTLLPHRVILGAAIIIFLTWANLRGVKESGKLFSIPTFVFIFLFLGMIAYGIWRFLNGDFPAVNNLSPVASSSFSAIGMILFLKAFASGCAAMTGIEATSNGVQAFKPPEAQNAAKTLLRMAVILILIFLGVTLLARWGQIIPQHDKTVVSQIAEMLFGRGLIYFFIQGATAVILILAANTPFAGFPRVASQLARDGYFPRQFLNLGSRLVFANGITALSAFAIFIIWLFGGNVHALIPLYAVGVFLGFSLSQLGMIRYWLKKGQGPIKNIVINAIGFSATAIVFLIVFCFKFLHGAWILLPMSLFLVVGMKKIKAHYSAIEKILDPEGSPPPSAFSEKTMILLVSEVNRATLYAIRFLKSFQPARLRVVHVAIDQEEAKRIKEKWNKNVPDVPIDILVSEFRDLIGPILNYLKDMDKKWEKDTLVVAIPEFIPPKFWQHFLHNQTALRIRFAIEQDPEIEAEIIDIPVKITTKLR